MRKQTIIDDRLDLLAPEHRDVLLDDLKARTRLPIFRARVQDIDLTSGRATQSVWHEGDAGTE